MVELTDVELSSVVPVNQLVFKREYVILALFVANAYSESTIVVNTTVSVDSTFPVTVVIVVDKQLANSIEMGYFFFICGTCFAY